ncbi:hypothetical protein WR25_21878 [Diploscapter pachys]|uniref:Uncharacterized protein n=1 Tax=Diploscapter pachys TaxID=2018661 RepID=A0A2A2M0U9_9BILA|nr:hypothetical protein WR25_21878 [Diploscapter pachys]
MRIRDIQSEDLGLHAIPPSQSYYDNLPTREVESRRSDFPINQEPYTGELLDTRHRRDVEGEPLQQHVSSYHVGHYDQLPTISEEQPKEGVLSKITGIFKKKEHESDYPTWIADSRPVDETMRIRDIQSEDLGLHAIPPSMSHYDSLPSREVESRRSDFPINQEPYLGELHDTRHRRDVEGEPLQQHVSSYHIGHYDQLPTQDQPKESTLSKITGLFKKRDHEPEYPHSEPFTGTYHESRYNEAVSHPLNTLRTRDLQGEPLSNWASTYHQGFYQDLPESEGIEKSKDEKHIDIADSAKEIASKVTGLFKKKERETSDYPTTIYSGPVNDTIRARDIQTEDLGLHAMPPSQMFYDTLPRKTIEVYEETLQTGPEERHHDIADTAKELAGKVTGLFKKKEHPEGYGYLSTEPYFGHLHDTRYANDVDSSPIDNIVAVYSPGFYSDLPITSMQERLPSEDLHKEKSKSLTSKLGGLFKKKEKEHSDYPTTIYTGPVNDTLRARDIQTEDLTSHVQPYSQGFYNTLPKKTIEVYEVTAQPVSEEKQHDITDTAKELAGKVTGLFKKKEHPSDFPSSEQYTGDYFDTRHHEISSHPLDSHVTVYHSGRSDEAAPKEVSYEFPTNEQPCQAISEEQPKEIGVLSKITGIFKKSDHEPEYPTWIDDSRPVDETSRIRDIDTHDLGLHAVPPTQSFYESLPTKVHEEVRSETSEPGKSLVDKFGSLFRKKEHESDYPTWIDDSRPVDETLKSREIPTSDLGLHAIPPSQSYYDNLLTRDVESRKSDFPINQEPYTGELLDTRHRRDVEGEPLQQHVSSYHIGHYDQLPTISEEQPKEGVLPKITGIFKKKEHESEYPTWIDDSRPVDETLKSREIQTSDLGLHAIPPSQSYYDNLPIRHVEEQRSEFPINQEPYLGELRDVHHRRDVEGISISHHISNVPAGFYENLQTPEQPEQEDKSKSLTSKLAGLFKKKEHPSDFPSSEPYTGDYFDTRHHEISSHPLSSHVTVYHSGRSDEIIEQPQRP